MLALTIRLSRFFTDRKTKRCIAVRAAIAVGGVVSAHVTAATEIDAAVTVAEAAPTATTTATATAAAAATREVLLGLRGATNGAAHEVAAVIEGAVHS